MELRCASKILHGIIDGDIIEVACKSRWCGKRPGVVVRHRFNKITGELVETREFSEPTNERKEHGAARQAASVRSA